MRNELKDLNITTKPFQEHEHGKEIRFRLVKNTVGHILQMEEKKNGEWRKTNYYSWHLEQCLILQMLDVLEGKGKVSDDG